MRNSVTGRVRFDVSRRGFLAAASGVASAVVMQGPGGVALADTGDVTYFTWAGYELPEFHQEFIDKYGGSPDSRFLPTKTKRLPSSGPDSRQTCCIPAPTPSSAGTTPM